MNNSFNNTSTEQNDRKNLQNSSLISSNSSSLISPKRNNALTSNDVRSNQKSNESSESQSTIKDILNESSNNKSTSNANTSRRKNSFNKSTQVEKNIFNDNIMEVNTPNKNIEMIKFNGSRFGKYCYSANSVPSSNGKRKSYSLISPRRTNTINIEDSRVQDNDKRLSTSNEVSSGIMQDVNDKTIKNGDKEKKQLSKIDLNQRWWRNNHFTAEV